MYKDVAKAVIIGYLSNGQTPDGLCDIYEIKQGNDELLLNHIKALRDIFTNAIKEMETEPLTNKQKKVLDAIVMYMKNRHCAPSVRELRRFTGLNSPSTIYKHLKNLEKKGYITMEQGVYRSVRLVKWD